MRTLSRMVFAAAACGHASFAFADAQGAMNASADELASVGVAIGALGCEAVAAEKEDSGFEVAQADCKIGTYEIELDGDFTVLSMSRVEAEDETGDEIVAELSPEMEEKIMALLASMRCEMDPDDIELDGDAIELDDVFCGGGQFDINLDSDMNVTGMRAE